MVRITISLETAARLRALKRHPRESYNDVIVRLLEDYEDSSPEALRRYAAIVKEVKSGKFNTNDQIRTEWGLRNRHR